MNKREKGTNKTKEAEKIVDIYISEFGCSPTYREVQFRLRLRSVNSAYYRLRNYRHKMVNAPNRKHSIKYKLK